MVGNKGWTKEETARLRRHFRAIGTRKLQDAFPGRSKRALDSKANELGLRKCFDRLKEAGRENRARRGLVEGPQPMPQVAPPDAA